MNQRLRLGVRTTCLLSMLAAYGAAHAGPISAEPLEGILSIMSPAAHGQDIQAGTDALAAGDAVSAQAAFMRALSRRPDDVFALLGMASSMQLKGERLEALNWTLRALEQKPTDPKVLEAYARLSYENKDLPAALRRVSDIVEANPASIEPRRALGRLYMLDGQPEAAVRVLSAAIDMPGADPALRIDLGRAQLLAGQADAATQTLENVRRIAPSSSEVLEPLARAELARGKPEISLAHLASLESTQDFDASTWALKGDVLTALSRHEAAAGAYGRASQAAPKASMLKLKQAQALDLSGQGAKALGVYDEVLAGDPDNLIALNNSAYLAASQGDRLDVALERAERALQVGGERAPLYDTLAAVQIARGDSAAARASLQRALKIDAGHGSARARLNTLDARKPVRDGAQAVAVKDRDMPMNAPAPAEPPVPAADIKVASAPTEPSVTVLAEAPAVPEPVIDPVADQVALADALEAWRQAWQGERYGDYVAAYVPDASPLDGMSRQRWERDRKRKLSKPGRLEITIESIEWTRIDEHTWTSRFVQHYASSNYRDKSLKTLRWERRGNGWRIRHEASKTL